MTEPVADEVRSILDGHIILSRALASRGHYPAIDIMKSASRVMNAVTTPEHVKAANRLRELYAAYEKNRDLILIGAYQKGSDALVDEAIEKMPVIDAFLRQGLYEKDTFEETVRRLRELVGMTGAEE